VGHNVWSRRTAYRTKFGNLFTGVGSWTSASEPSSSSRFIEISILFQERRLTTVFSNAVNQFDRRRAWSQPTNWLNFLMKG
jgi:hypothetical protein